MRIFHVFAVLLLVVGLLAGLAGVGPAHAEAGDAPALVIVNGNIITVDDRQPRAQAVAVRDGLILAVGSNAEIAALKGPGTKSLDLAGATLIPGFIEAHAHLLYLGRALQELKLAQAATWSEVVDMVARAARDKPPGEWIIGSGWHQEKWREAPAPAVEGYPTHDALSRVSPDNPVLLYHASGHAALANARAMQQAGLEGDAPSPAGGRILRDAQGRPTGVLLDAAIAPVRQAAEHAREEADPRRREARTRQTVAQAEAHALARGITSFQDAGSSFATIDVLAAMARQNALRLRLWVMINEPNERLAKRLSDYRIEDAGGRLTVRAVKRFMDGALGSRTAWLLTPYADAPSQTGLNTTPPEAIADTARLVRDHGFQLCVHAIGDRANRETLDLFEAAFAARGLPSGLRWRIEHAQHLNPEDIPRFAELGVIASMQPVHATSDGPWVETRIGPRRAEAGAYVWRRLLDNGAVIAIGTDAPVEGLDPIANYYAAVTRRLPDGTRFYPDQNMTRAEALQAYTLDNAYAALEEKVKGSVTPGKYADFTILSQDITTVDEAKIPDTRVLYTIVGGKIEYAAAASASGGKQVSDFGNQ
jgi:predicted amidohydrolase YtcJ